MRLPCSPSRRTAQRIALSIWMLIPFLLQMSLAADAAPQAQPTIETAQQVSRQQLSQQLAQETGIPADEIRAILQHATYRPQIIARMQRQWEAQPYSRYRPLFIKPSLKRKGRAYLASHRAIFAQVEQKYGVDAVIIAAILAIETRFGHAQGSRPVLDSLYTLSTGFPRRADFFRHQLGALINISRRDQLDLTTLKGSYAGAFGAIQFIPTSFEQYAVDEDGDGIRDVIHSQRDIIASVANYFAKHGWQHHRPSAYWLPAGSKLTPQWQQHIESDNISQWRSLGELRHVMPAAFAHLPSIWHDNDQVSLIRMQRSDGMRVALIHHNFRVIMRYNPSFNYAMAVTEIAAMLERGEHRFAVE